jgi:methyl-accepting chemotaxis protein
MNSHNKRRTYLVNKEVQLRFAALLVFISLLTAIQLYVCIAFIDSDLVSQAAKYGLTNDQTVLSFILLQNKRLLIQVLAFLVFNMFLVGVFGFFFSHRMAGPVYRMEKFIKKIAEGDLSGTVRLRKGDHFQSFATSINLMVECLRQKRRDELEMLHSLYQPDHQKLD